MYSDHPFGVWFTGTNWAIFNQDFAWFTNPSWNVLVGPPAAASADGTAFIHRVTSWNISGNLTRIDHPLLNGNRNARLIVTPSYNPDQPRGVYNNRTLGVFYDGRMWGIYNDTGGNVSLGAAFNVLVPRDQSNPPAGPIGGGGTVSQGG